MIRSGPRHKLRGLILPLGARVVAVLVLLTTIPVRSAQNAAPQKSVETLPPPSAVNDQAAMMTPKPKEEPKKSNFEKTKTDAAELSALADQLRDELNKMNVNVFSLDVLQKTEKLEQLAKKIKGEANGH
jgi:hypothetical protein